MEVELPALPISVDHAPLPVLYVEAKHALEKCASIDECREWANRMDALASYARQSEDEELFAYAKRIRSRAVDRTGALLREIPAAKTGPKADIELGGGGPTELGRMEAARKAGLSKDQAVTAIRVNNVPRDQFEGLVESANPPTVEQLANMGRKPRESAPVVDYLGARDPADFEQGTRLLGLLRHLVEKADALDLAAAVRGLSDAEHVATLTLYCRASVWLKELGDVLQQE